MQYFHKKNINGPPVVQQSIRHHPQIRSTCRQSPIQSRNSLEHKRWPLQLSKNTRSYSVTSREVSGLLTDFVFPSIQTVSSGEVGFGSVRSKTDTDRNMNMFIFKLKKSKFKEHKNGVSCDLWDKAVSWRKETRRQSASAILKLPPDPVSTKIHVSLGQTDATGRVGYMV